MIAWLLNTPKNELEVRRTSLFSKIRKKYLKFSKTNSKNFEFSMLVCVRGAQEFCPKHARTRIELKLIEFRLCLESLIYLILLGYFGKVENLQGS